MTLPRRRAVLVGALGAGVALFGAGAPLARLGRARPLNDADLLRFVELMALSREGGSGVRRPGWVRRWTRGIEVGLAGEGWKAHLDELDGMLATLGRWTGLPVARRSPDGWRRGHLTIRLLPHDEVAAHHGAGGTVCSTWTFGDGGRLHTAHMDVSDRFTDCLAHEFMHVLGIDNHWSGPDASTDIPSVLAPRGGPGRTIQFSDWDEMAIRLLYHPEIRPGMSRDQALSAMKRLLVANAVARPLGRPT